MSKNFIVFAALLAFHVSAGMTLMRVHDGAIFQALDVGQGDALLLTTPEQHHILIDGGPDSRVLEELGDVLPFLWKDIDLLVLTHPHEDHVNGLVPILERLKVKAVLLSAPDYENLAYSKLLKEIIRQDIPTYVARADQDFRFGSLTLDVLYPLESVAGETVKNVNNASVVIRVVVDERGVEDGREAETQDGVKTLLLMGDAEQEVEVELLEWKEMYTEANPLQANILKAGHHGSRTSSTWDFLEAVSPEVMVISCGEGNTYGHPHEETLEKAEDLGIRVFRTDVDGRITVFLRDL